MFAKFIYLCIVIHRMVGTTHKHKIVIDMNQSIHILSIINIIRLRKTAGNEKVR